MTVDCETPQKFKPQFSNIKSPWKTQCQKALVWTVSVRKGKGKSRLVGKGAVRKNSLRDVAWSGLLKSGHHLGRKEREGHLKQGKGNSKDTELKINTVWRTGRKWGSC